MLFVAFLQWWYGPGWSEAVRNSKRSLDNLTQDFSIQILFRTLFAPWKQIDAFGRVNQSLGDKFRHAVDKFVSRFVGFIVRSITLMAAGVSFIAVLIARALWIICWPLLPLSIPVLLLYGLGVF